MKLVMASAGVSIMGLSPGTFAQRGVAVDPVQVDPTRPDWGNPAIYARNKRPARATGFAFESRDRALAGHRTQSSRFLSLNGDWAFHFSPSVDGAPKGFEAPGYNVAATGAWKPVAANRQLHALTTRRLPDGAVEMRVDHAPGAVAFVTTYTMAGDGSVAVVADPTLRQSDLPPPIRVGMSYALPQSMTTVGWYGRGPHESHLDRRTSAPIGLWRGKGAEQNHGHGGPQDTGNKVDVRWRELSARDAALRIVAERLLMMQALAFPYADPDRRPPGTRRSSDIVPQDQVSLDSDAAQWGVGGDTTWRAVGQPHMQYRTKAESTPIAFRFEPFTGAGTDADKTRPEHAMAAQ